jgi:hypothetical protein
MYGLLKYIIKKIIHAVEKNAAGAMYEGWLFPNIISILYCQVASATEMMFENWPKHWRRAVT